jgi:ferredoxin
MKVNKGKCDICGTCVSVCPVDAIFVSEFEVQIDNNKCVVCLNCKIVCPFQAITGDDQ